jgi:hypothetical protein
MREAGESLEGAGKLMIIFIFGHVYTLTVASEQKLFMGLHYRDPPVGSRDAGAFDINHPDVNGKLPTASARPLDASISIM